MIISNKCLSAALKLVIITVLSLLVWGCDDNSSTIEVVASFEANVRSIEEGEVVQFTDQSEGNPISWEWQFEGGIPSSSTTQNPTVQYDGAGLYAVTLKVTNEDSEDTKTEPGFIEVICPCSNECSESCKSQLLEDQSLSVNGAERSYDVYLPSSHDISQNLPVIIDLHGYTSSSSEQRSISNFTDLAEENNIVMVWPEALASGTSCVLPGVSGIFWNADWGSEVDDVAFIDQLLDQLESDYNIDPKRIYVTGLSNGGFMAYSIACALSDRIAAVTSVAGSMTENLLTTECSPTRKIPVMHIHGTNDQIVPWDGKDNCYERIASINDVVSFWRTNAGCSDTFTEVAFENTVTSDGSTARMLTYDGCGNQVKFLVVDGGGHNWPGSQYQIDQGFSVLLPINRDFVTEDVIWEFFKEHSLE